ncbi:MAG: hypothetical protein EA398_15650 [Deltaproteobacteria bacterium]|nr:MAG: hypothetical protein EA398_15650 [Deltaproteobacteria bacterium]
MTLPAVTLLAGLALAGLAAAGCGGDLPDPSVFEVVGPEDTDDLDGPYPVAAVLMDRRGIQEARVRWEIDGETRSALLENVRDDRFEGGIPGQPALTTVRWWLVIRAGGEVTTFPADAPATAFEFRVLEPPPPPPPVECGDEICEEGEICLPREGCVPASECSTSADCEVGLVCVDGACTAARDVPAERCGTTVPCPDGLTCRFGECVPERCFVDDDCPPEHRCFSGECFGQSSPLPDGCDRDADCAEGEQCVVNLCVPRQCRNDRDCGEGETCLRGFCLPFENPLPIPIPECVTDRDCPSIPGLFETRCVLGVCLPTDLLPIPVPDGCTDARDCDPGQTCLANLCIDAQCERNADCGPGQECLFGFCAPEGSTAIGTCTTADDCVDGGPCVFGFCLPIDVPIDLPF